MGSRLRWPKTKSVVVLNNGYATLHAGLLHRRKPLFGVGCLSGRKSGFGLVAVTPLQVRVGVHSVMEKSVKLRLLPKQLPFRRHGLNGSGFVIWIGKRLRLQRQPRLSTCRQRGECGK